MEPKRNGPGPKSEATSPVYITAGHHSEGRFDCSGISGRCALCRTDLRFPGSICLACSLAVVPA